MAWDTKVESAIGNAAQRFGVDPRLLKTFARIESGGRPNARTGSYKGLFQLSDREFGKYGGGNIYDPEANASAAAQKLARESAAFKAKYGRDPAPNDLYMIHQQGEGGYAAHSANPDAPAWQNMYSTAEGRQKGPGWAKQAIWGNVPSDVRAQYPGGVDSLTSKQFMDLWAQKVARMGGDAPASSHMAANAVNQVANGAPQTMAGPIGGAPIAGGPVPLTPPNMRYSKLADALMAQAAGADIKGWGDALRSLGGAALGYSLANKADTQQGEYKSKLAQALGAAKDPEALTQTLLSSGDDDLVKQGVALQIAKQKPQDQIGRFRPTKQGVVDTTNGQIVPGTEGQAAEAAEYGTSPQYFVDKDGNLKVGQLSKAGGMKAVDLPEGAKAWSPGIDYKDAGTEFVGLNKRTGQVESTVDKNIAQAEAQKAVGKGAGEAQLAIPAAKSTVENAFKTIAELEAHPGLDAGTGLSSVLDPRSWTPGTDAYNFRVKNTQAQAQSFMGARESLKGAGQVTDFEGERGQTAIAALNAAQSKEQYLQAVKDLKRMMQASYDDLVKKAGMAGGATAPAPQMPAANQESLQARKQKWNLE